MMGAPDCELCAGAGLRSCDLCWQPFEPGTSGRVTSFGVEVCATCDALVRAVRP